MDANAILTNVVMLIFFIFGIYCQIIIKKNEKEIKESNKNS